MNRDEKRKKLASLKDEVKEFHPLLKSLFQNMSRFKNVDYTHGPNEMGADFVLTRFDDLLSETFYTGIVVKLGKIHQNLDNIERQIEECSQSRLTLSGKKVVTITEIWVITNETVTNGAATKIHRKFKDKHIVFVNYQKVLKWIDDFFENYWYDFGIETGAYLEKLNYRVMELEKQCNLLKDASEPFYIEQDIYKKTSEYKKPKMGQEKILNVFEIIKNNQITIIEGSWGSGKSKLIRHLTAYYSSGDTFAETKILPILINYKDIWDKYSGKLQKLIEAEVNLEKFNEEGKGLKILLLIDAVDEKKLPNEEQVEKLEEVINWVYEQPNLSAVFTTRPLHAYGKDSEFFERGLLYGIRTLSLKKIVAFLFEICKQTNISNRIIEDLKKSQLFRELGKSPIAAILLANLINENSNELPSNITELYSKYTELSLGRWDIQKGLKGQKEYEAIDQIVMELSDFFIANGLQSISKDEAINIFKEYLRKRNLDLSAEDLYEKVIVRSGLLIESPFNNTVSFKHKTFAEFMYARYHKEKNDLIVDTRIFDTYWANIFFFYVGLRKNCLELLNKIISVKPENHAQEFHRIINISNFLLAGFTSPYEIVEKNIHTIIIEAATLYHNIVTRKIETPLSFLPEIHLLCLFQHVVRESYGYEYFQNAIELITIKISESTCSEEIKPYALFFIAATSMELGNPDPFDFLLDNYKAELPLSLRLGLYHESKKLPHLSALVKKTLKKLKQRRGQSTATTSLIETFYDVPVNVRKIT